MFRLSSTIYLDTYEKEYYRILKLNKKPPGPLGNYVVRIKENRRSPFESSKLSDCCIYGIKHLPGQENSTHCNRYNTYMTIDDLDVLFDFLVENNYSINKEFTKVVQKNDRLNNKDDFICYISYI